MTPGGGPWPTGESAPNGRARSARRTSRPVLGSDAARRRRPTRPSPSATAGLAIQRFALPALGNWDIVHMIRRLN